MADLTCTYTLTTGGGTIVFNNGTIGSTTDLYWIQAIQGLSMPTIRAPVDNAPQADGGLIHNFWFGPRRVVIDGVMLAQSVGQNQCNSVFYTMEKNLIAALSSILRTAGTLAWTSADTTAHSISVYCEVPLDVQPSDNYATRAFNFGLVAASSSA